MIFLEPHGRSIAPATARSECWLGRQRQRAEADLPPGSQFDEATNDGQQRFERKEVRVNESDTALSDGRTLKMRSALRRARFEMSIFTATGTLGSG
jgi:hypothetical protein